METKKSPSHPSVVSETSAPVLRARFVCLIVDDGTRSTPALAELLETGDLEVVAAGSASEALGILHERVIDMVVAEECLPGENGNHLLETVRSRWPKIGRVLVSRELDPKALLQAINRARVERVLHRKTSAQSLRREIEAALYEMLVARNGDALQCAAGSTARPARH